MLSYFGISYDLGSLISLLALIVSDLAYFLFHGNEVFPSFGQLPALAVAQELLVSFYSSFFSFFQVVNFSHLPLL